MKADIPPGYEGKLEIKPKEDKSAEKKPEEKPTEDPVIKELESMVGKPEKGEKERAETTVITPQDEALARDVSDPNVSTDEAIDRAAARLKKKT